MGLACFYSPPSPRPETQDPRPETTQLARERQKQAETGQSGADRRPRNDVINIYYLIWQFASTVRFVVRAPVFSDAVS